MKIVVLDGFTLNPGDLSWDGFKALGDLTVYDRTPANKTIERIGDAAIVITNKTIINEDVLKACPRIKYIGVLATGYNVVDIKRAQEQNIIVTNIPAYGTAAVAQFTIGLLLEVCHHIGEHSRSVHKGEWAKSPDFSYWRYPLIELAGKTMGIVGFGRIGQAVGAIAQALGMNVLVYSRREIESLKSDTLAFVSLDDLFAQADVISLHCPLGEETQGIINKQSIASMKDGVIIINTSRGPLIVEEDLAEALTNGKVYGAGLDVVTVEPLPNDNPLLGCKNCIITPHIAWAPQEARKRLMDMAAQNLAKFLANTPIHVVSK